MDTPEARDRVIADAAEVIRRNIRSMLPETGIMDKYAEDMSQAIAEELDIDGLLA